MAAHHEKPYKYETLPIQPATIRLLKLFPSTESPITCSLKSFKLSDAPRYHALSYTWGDPLDQRLSSPASRRTMSKELDKLVTTDDGLVIGATENLLDALDELSASQVNTGDQPYWWIDAICIDQNNIEEKGVQVAMMDKVYAKAEKVVIWLGKEDEHTEGALKVLNGLAELDTEPKRVSLKNWSSDGHTAGDELMDASDYFGLRDIEDADWLDYGAFLQRNWFSRIWVVQEKFFARDTEILCGKYVIPWTTVMKSSEVLTHTRMDTLLKALVDYTLSGTKYNINTAAVQLPNNRLDNQQIFSTVRKGDIQNMGLDKLLYYTKTFDATNDRDKIFAIKGVWEDSRPVSGGQSSIRTDYLRSIEDVYSEATLLAIRESKSLDILGLVEDPLSRKRQDLATWTPDYSSGPMMYPLVLASHQPVVSSHWRSSQGISFNTPETTCGNELAVNGVKIDEVVQVGPKYIEVMNGFQLGLLLQVLADNAQKQYRSDELCGDAFLRTLIKNTFAEQPVGEEAREAFAAFIMKRIQEFDGHVLNLNIRGRIDEAEAFWQQLEGLKSTLDELSSKFHIVPSVLETLRLISQALDEGSDEEKELEDKRKGMEESFRIAYLGRRIFATKQGYFGITSESVGIGDIVWILAGARTPYVLRNNIGDKKSKIVGEAYVDGLMQGEAAVGKTEQIILV
ncbi:HET-domain-containing protein [Xylariaceae sp. AK1471]|nr:HET-domain-containing protein [Xylariaceae sp. AK1471]